MSFSALSARLCVCTIDEKEESSRLIGYSSSHQCFPVPGGPYSRIPLGGWGTTARDFLYLETDMMSRWVLYSANLAFTPMALNRPGCLRGSSTISLIWASCFRQPPMSSYPMSFRLSSSSWHRRHITSSRGVALQTVQVWWPHTHLSFDWFSLAVDDGIRGNDAVRGGVCFHHFKLHCSHASSHQENITCGESKYTKSCSVLVHYGKCCVVI